LGENVAATLARHGIAPERLVLEITENVLIGELGDAHRAIESTAKLGVRIALDDFGTGYSTLAHLRHLRTDILKIDRSFVSQLGGHSRDREIIAAVTGMAHALGMTVVAEGVEAQAQRDELTAIGCDAAQGNLIAQPLTADVFATMFLPAQAARRGSDETLCGEPVAGQARTERSPSELGAEGGREKLPAL
jgi:EAL domain-containing protein (putative c-di-GMP-specific phosphodiesterase class I)